MSAATTSSPPSAPPLPRTGTVVGTLTGAARTVATARHPSICRSGLLARRASTGRRCSRCRRAGRRLPSHRDPLCPGRSRGRHHVGLDGAGSVVVPPGLALDVPGAVVDDGLTHTGLDAVGAVVTTVAVGIAETETVVLDHGTGQGRRVITLLPDLHVCVVREDQVVPDVPDALPRLDPHRPQTWISGPSATSDIVLSRVEGVHGPRRLHVVLVGR